MKELNLYILEKLKIDKTSKVSGDKKGYYGIHDNKAVDKILYLSNIKDTDATIERAVESWVKEYDVLDVEGYSYEIIGITDEDEQDGAVAKVNIYNKDKSKFVQYKLLFGEKSELLLLYPETGKIFTIEL